MSRNNTYGFFRYDDNEAVFVFVNASEEPRRIPTETYKEILNRYNPMGFNPLSGEQIDLSRTDMEVKGLSSMIVKLTR